MIWLVFLMMVASFLLLVLAGRLPGGLALGAAAAIGLIAAGQAANWPHLIEGSLTYLDAMLIIAGAMIFMRSLVATGKMQIISAWLVRRFGANPWLLLPLLMLYIMFPGMLTGSSTAAVLTSGALAAPVLAAMGLGKGRAAAIVAIGGLLGMVAPPVNIPVLIIGSGVDMPYTGFTWPLLALCLPLALFSVYLLGWPVLRRPQAQRLAAASLEECSPVPAAPAQDETPVPRRQSVRWAATPVLALCLWMIVDRIWPGLLPATGLPLLFLGGAALSYAMTGKGPWWRETLIAVQEALPVLSILAGVGMFIQVMTLTGARGTLVVALLSLPQVWLLVAAAVGIPLFGAISAYGAASVLGVPFLLAMLGKNEIVVGAALSMLAAVGDVMPPTAIAGRFAARVVGMEKYTPVLRACLLPILAILLAAVLAIGLVA